MRSFVLGAIALLATAAVASAGVTMGIGQAPGSMGGAVVLDPGLGDLPATLTLYMNFVVDANSPSGARSVEGRVAVDAPGVAELVTDFEWGTYGTYSWSAYANTFINGATGYMNTHYNDESVDGVFGAGKMWDTALWLDMNGVEGPIASDVGCPGVATASRIGGAAGATARLKGGPGGAFLPADPVMTLAILTITIPADAPAGNYTIGVCDAYFADVASGGALDITPGDGVSLQIVPEPTAALLLIGALPFLRRRR